MGPAIKLRLLEGGGSSLRAGDWVQQWPCEWDWSLFTSLVSPLLSTLERPPGNSSVHSGAEKGWQVIFFPSHGPYKDPAVTRRVLDIYDFMNSKVHDLQPCCDCCTAGLYPTIQRHVLVPAC